MGRVSAGHYPAGFTLDTYTYTTSDMQKAAANKVGSSSHRRSNPHKKTQGSAGAPPWVLFYLD